MASYISSNDNRLYVAAETSFGRVPAIAATNRIPAVKFRAKQTTTESARRDKTGSRTFRGQISGARRDTEYQLRTYLAAWTDQSHPPGYGALIEAALGASPQQHPGGVLAAGSGESTLSFTTPHGLTPGQAVATGGELRFVSRVVNTTAVELNAPLSTVPGAGSIATPTITYRAAKSLPSASIMECWSPGESVQRILNGAAVDRFTATVNGDFHELEFRGPAQDLIDTTSFTGGQGELSSFPGEPATDGSGFTLVPGHLGEVWMGSIPQRFFTLTSAQLVVENTLEKRVREFGRPGLQAVVPGSRNVTADFELYASDESSTKALYAAARRREAVGVMFQLGQQAKQLFGVYLKNVVPEIPEFDDTDTRLSWKFSACRAQGDTDDEIVVALG